MSTVGAIPKIREAGFFDESFQRKWTTDSGVTLTSNGDEATLTSTNQTVSGAGINRVVSIDTSVYSYLFTRARWIVNPGQVDLVLWPQSGSSLVGLLSSGDPVNVWKVRNAILPISTITQLRLRFENAAFPIPKTSVAEVDYTTFAKSSATELEMLEFEKSTERILSAQPIPLGDQTGTEVSIQDRGQKSPTFSMNCRLPIIDLRVVKGLTRKYVYLEEFVYGGGVFMMNRINERKQVGTTREVSIEGVKAVNW